jgi:Mn-dependent DtxR family transcriptional regulator
MLFAIKAAPYVTQAHLQRLLGVCRMTVSTMIRHLVRLRLVRRERDSLDERTFRVRLTALGRALVRQAQRVFRRERLVQPYLVDCCFLDRDSSPKAAAGKFIADVEDLAWCFGDEARLRYPSPYPDDRKPLFYWDV